MHVCASQTQVRSHLLQEIKRQGSTLAANPAGTPRQTSLRQRAVDSLVLAHLHASACEYTASIFVPEAGLSDGAMAPSDILSTLGLAAGSTPTEDGHVSPLLAALAALAAPRPRVAPSRLRHRRTMPLYCAHPSRRSCAASMRPQRALDQSRHPLPSSCCTTTSSRTISL